MTNKFEATRIPSTTMSGVAKGTARIARILRARLIEPVVRWHRCAAMVRQLSALDDRTLDDIGISRYRIPAAVAEAYASRLKEKSAAAGASLHRLPVEDKDGPTKRVDILRSKAA